MLKTIIAGALALVMSMTGGALADKLDPKWASARKSANALGDAAKAGEKRAFQMLVNKAALGDAPAMHNIGWLYQSGYPGVPANPEKSCGWFRKAAKRAYPPSMYNHGLCLFASAKDTKDKSARTRLEEKAYEALFEASKAGWTKSAIYMSEKVLNHPFFKPRDTKIASKAIGIGLESNPTKSQRVTLSYLKGMAVIYGSGSSSYYYQAGLDALHFAEKNGHPHAGKALPTLYSKWVRSHINLMALWSPPKLSGLDCYRKNQANSTRKSLAALKCTGYDSRKKKELERLKKVSETLQFKVSHQEKADLKIAMNRLNDRSAQFSAGIKELTDIFARNFTKENPRRE